MFRYLLIKSGLTIRLTPAILIWLFCLIVPIQEVIAQEFSYSRFDIREGLAGSTVYCVAQDKAGFLWFGTENGLSRFDGQSFTNYTTNNGLPDNEIISLFCDSRGRLWFAPFRNTIGYFYKGQLHTQENDSALARLQFQGAVMGMEEDRQGTIAFIELTGLHLLFSNNQVKNWRFNSSFSDIGLSEDGQFLVFHNGQCLKVEGDRFVSVLNYRGMFRFHDLILGPRNLIIRKNGDTHLVNYESGGERLLWNNAMHISFGMLNDSQYVDNGRNGAFICQINKSAPVQTYLKGKVITQTFADDEGDLWFCTQGEGIYRLNSGLIRSLRFTDRLGRINSAQSLIKVGEDLYVGTELGNIFKLAIPESGSDLQSRLLYHARSESPVAAMAWSKKYGLAFSEDSAVRFLPSGDSAYVNGGIKYFQFKGSDQLAVSNSNSVVILDKNRRWQRLGYPKYMRSTCLYALGDTLYVGTLVGLFKIIWRPGEPADTNTVPLLKGRISGIQQAADQTLWISRYGDGLVQLANDKVIRRITESEGLSSNICRKIFLKDSMLWVATDKGVNKINANRPYDGVLQYRSTDGLISDLITSIYADDSLIYVGTAEGISFFDDSRVSHLSTCRLVIRRVTVSGNSIPFFDSATIRLERKQNNIRFDFSGISYRSGGNMIFRYYLEGLDTAWQQTRENFLSYPSLQPGDYRMRIQAINRFGVASMEKSVGFTIVPFWWERWFVWLIAVLLFGLAAYYFISRRIHKIRMEMQEKARLQAKLVSLEHLALRAQMNPHFIFNSLNSIQHFVLMKDIMGANQYLAGLSKLIRLTLEYSAFEEIRARDEIEYLRLYLELEKSRTNQKFDFTIHLPDEIRNGFYFLPPMILQPFVENSIRHGIRYRNDKKGHIFVGVEKYDQALHFIIRDNGVGRARAAEYNRPGHIEYQSRGIELTVQRIGLLNRQGQAAAGVAINDVFNHNGEVEGTEVIVTIPI